MFVVLYHLRLLFLRIHQNFEPLSLSFFKMDCFYCRGFSSLETQLYTEKEKNEEKKNTKKIPEKHYKKF